MSKNYFFKVEVQCFPVGTKIYKDKNFYIEQDDSGEINFTYTTNICFPQTTC